MINQFKDGVIFEKDIKFQPLADFRIEDFTGKKSKKNNQKDKEFENFIASIEEAHVKVKV